MNKTFFRKKEQRKESQRTRHKNRPNGREQHPELDPVCIGTWYFIVTWKRWTIWLIILGKLCYYLRKIELYSHLIPYSEVNSWWIKDLKLKVSHYRNKCRLFFAVLGGEGFLNGTLKVYTIRENIFEYIKNRLLGGLLLKGECYCQS